MGNFFAKPTLTPFQKSKLLHEFQVFFDVNKDGKLEVKDFDIARNKICRMSGWKDGSDKYVFTQELFKDIWRNLQDTADEDIDGAITTEEWMKMWTKVLTECCKTQREEEKIGKLPEWVDKYIHYKFRLFDRTGDGLIDIDEFEYVLSDFGTPSKDSRAAFIMFSENQSVKIDLPHFQTLYREYFLSDNPSDLGNFINGRIMFGT